MKKILVLVVVGILVLLVASVAAREVIVDETARVQIDDYRFYAMYLNDGDKITVQIQQTAKGLFGPPTVDVYLFDSKQFDEYQKLVAGYAGGFGECYSAKDIVQKTFTWTASRPDTYYLVLDNTERLRGGGVYGGIIVDVRVEKETNNTGTKVARKV